MKKHHQLAQDMDRLAQLHCYRIFDIGPDLSLEDIALRMGFEFQEPLFHRSVVLMSRSLTLPQGDIHIDGTQFKVFVKFWSFGVMTVIFKTDFGWENPNDLVRMMSRWEYHPEMNKRAKEVAEVTLKNLSLNRFLFDRFFEDYIVLTFQDDEFTINNDVSQLMMKYRIPQILMGEENHPLSHSVLETIKQGLINYYQKEFIFITWNSTVIINPVWVDPILEMLELALCQVLEMRYYDDQLQHKLSEIYAQERQKQGLFGYDRVMKNALEASRTHMEILELVEKVENSLKILGDLYLAQIFTTASRRFRFFEWKEDVMQKLRFLSDYSEFVIDQINAQKSHILELIIILLIAIELIPYLGNIISYVLQ